MTLKNILGRSFLFLFGFQLAIAQELQVKVGSTNIALNEYFTITITLQNEQLKTYSNFPEIPGFQKRGVSSQSSTNIVNGQITYSQSIVQNYAPTKEGKFKLPNITLEVNGRKVQVAAATVNVGAAKQQQEYDTQVQDPFAEFFGRGGSKEYIDVKDEAFFALTSTKDKVYVGEGFTITLAFYVSQSNKAKMQFYDLGTQMQSILKKIKPANCWEENFGIDEIQPQEITIEGKKYTEYKLYRATLYPLNKEPIKFPALPLKMIKFKVAKVQSFFGFNNEKQSFKDFVSKPKTIYVKDLPQHPLKDNVSVGDFKLEENVKNSKFITGKSINYNFKIVGEGNISSIKNPQQYENNSFDIYPPNIYQDINRSGLIVTGAKNFNYFLIPKEPGTYKLNNLLYWVYFNTKTERYDTLKPKLTLNITGESNKNLAVGATDFNDFGEILEKYDNNFINLQKDEFIKWIANGFLLIMFVLTLAIILKR
jgi:hypothetical protein